MPIKLWGGALLRVGIAVLFAGIFYTGWLAAFLAVFRYTMLPLIIAWQVLMPAATAFGFAVGMLLAERLVGVRREGFLRMFLWPFGGCVLGALVIVWYGPMLMVFAMFLAGTGSLVLREIMALFLQGKDAEEGRPLGGGENSE
jgi:hypothetical protein